MPTSRNDGMSADSTDSKDYHASQGDSRNDNDILDCHDFNKLNSHNDNTNAESSDFIKSQDTLSQFSPLHIVESPLSSQSKVIASQGILEPSTHKAQKQDYSNFFFLDIFKRPHRFFRPFTCTTPSLKVRTMPNAYIFSDKDLIWTKNRKILISHTLYFQHEFSPTTSQNKLKKLYSCIKLLAKWAKFYIHLINAKYIDARVAVVYWGENIGHFNAEHCGNLHQILDSGVEVDYFILPQENTFHKFMIDKLQIPQDKILSPKPNRLLRIRELIVPTLYPRWEAVDYRDKTSWASNFPFTPYVYNMHNFLVPKVSPKRKIFLQRPTDSNRVIKNANEVEAVFVEFGYEIILPDVLGMSGEVELFNNAKIIASLQGSGLANVLFMQKGAFVFEIYPSFWNDPFLRILSVGRGLKYFYMVCESECKETPQKDTAIIDIKSLRLALQILESYL